MANQTDIWSPQDYEFLPDAELAERAALPRAARYLVLAIIAILTLMLIWASFARLDEVTHAQGKVVPSAQVKTIQHLEGGIISAFYVSEGDIVRKDQTLVQLENKSFESTLEESKVQQASLQATITRLQFELQGQAPEFLPSLQQDWPEIVAAELSLHKSRQQAQQSELAVLRNRLSQKQKYVEELQSRLRTLRKSARLAHEELRMSEDLANKQIISQVEFLRLKRSTNDLDGEIQETSLALERAKTAITENEQLVQEKQDEFNINAAEELRQKQTELAQLDQQMGGSQSRVQRMLIRSPVDGIIKSVRFSTLGGVVRAGEPIMEIVPVGDKLVVDGRVAPKDIGYLAPGQPALVKVSAYDYRRYGGLEGTLVQISPDTSIDENGEPYYKIRVETVASHLGNEADKLSITAGMTVTIDIRTGWKTVMEYLTRPFIDLQDNALTEH